MIATAAGLLALGGNALAAQAGQPSGQANPYPVPMQASTMAVAPLYVGPAWGEGNTQADAATLHVQIDNTGTVPDRLVRIDCAPIGQAALLNGIVRQVDGVQQNGLDIPARATGSDAPVGVQASISLTGTQYRLVPGATVSCVLGFLNAGERLAVFTIGAGDTPVAEP